MSPPGIWELLLILGIVLLIFGTKKLKTLGTDLGSAIKGFKKAITTEEETTKPGTGSESVADNSVADNNGPTADNNASEKHP